MTKAAEAALICDEGGEKGMFFPAGPTWEQSWPQPVKVIAYGLALAWAFLGVALIADVFMSAIEAITSKKKRVFNKETGRWKTIKVWNETVANLTLMALGSSAPEILLNVVEVFNNSFYAGELGPGTIVGSAAFNLLVISAVCIAAIPNGEVRIINDVAVYVVTAFFSVFAYVWMIFVLMIVSPDIVDLWEALVTFSFFPLLVCISFAADKGYISGVPAMANRRRIVAAEMTKEEVAEIVKAITDEFGEVDDATLAVLIEKRTAARPSKAAYRRVNNSNSLRTSTSWAEAPDHKALGLVAIDRNSKVDVEEQATVEFATSNYALRESDKFVKAKVCRYGNDKSKVTLKYRTVEGTATAGKDYVHVEGTVEFAPGTNEAEVQVEIIDDDEWEGAEDFYIEVYEPTCDSSVALGSITKTTVTIIDDDDPGCFTFDQEFVTHDADASDTLVIRVNRRQGSKGEVSCAYKTENDSAVSPLDYDALDERLTFKDGELSKIISIVVKPRGRHDSTERFRLILSDAVGGRFDKKGDGDETQTTCTIELGAGPEAKAKVDKLVNTLAGNFDKMKLGKENWAEQFSEALYCGGSREEQAQASTFDMVIHVLSLPWKLVFACVPPTQFAGGWACFFVALLFIGAVTAMIGDLAMCFGCALTLPNQVTAITFVALGTSLPDTFASKSAACQDPYADASITNITGSNSVNVFLGLGLPWTVAALYWQINGATAEWTSRAPASVLTAIGDKNAARYVLVGGDIGFSVAIFCTCALSAMGWLAVRRVLFKGELGGPKNAKWMSACFFVLLWFIYVAASWVYIEVSKDD